MSIEFAVKVKGIHDPDADECAWVLAVERDGLPEKDADSGFVLIVHKDKSLHWHPLEDCEFAMAKAPGPPKVPAMAPKLVTPNRVERRALERNGAQ